MKPSTTSQILTTKCVFFHTRESEFLRVLELRLQYPQAPPELQQGREAPGAPLHNPAAPCSFTAGERALCKRVASTCWRWETLMRDHETPLLVGRDPCFGAAGMLLFFSVHWKRSDPSCEANRDLPKPHAKGHKHTRLAAPKRLSAN